MYTNITEEDHFLSQLIDNVDEGVVIHDENGAIILANNQAEWILGLEKSALTGRKSPDLEGLNFIKEDGMPFPTDLHPANVTLRTGERLRNIIMGIEHKDGPIKWISINAKKIEIDDRQLVMTTFYDVTKQINAKKDSDRNKSALEVILSSIDDLIFELDENGTFLNVWTSDESKLFMSKEGFIGLKLGDLFPGALSDRLQSSIDQIIAHGGVARIEYQNPLDPAPIEWYEAKLRRVSGSHSRVTMIVSEITQYKQAELAEKEIEERWQFAIEANGDGIWDWNIITNEVYHSRELKEMLGYEGHEMKNHLSEWEKRVHPGDLKRVHKDLEDHFSGLTKIYSSEHRLLCKNGEYKWILDRGKVVSRDRDGKPLRMIGTHTDTSEQRQREEAIRLSERKFSSAFEYAGIGISLITPTGNLLEVNPSMCSILGYSKEELEKLNLKELAHHEDLRPSLDGFSKILSNQIPYFQRETRYLHKSGKLIWGIMNVSLVWNDDATPKFFILQIQEITIRKQLMAELSEKNTNLEHLYNGLQQKIEQMEEFNMMVAHNLRGPSGNIGSLLRLYNEADEKEIKDELMELLITSSSQLSDTLNSLMQLLQIRLNKSIPMEECHFEEKITKVTKLLSSEIMEKGAKIELDISAKTVDFPKIYLESIILNLISNGLKYSDKERAVIIRISTRIENGQTIMEVADNGLGIDLDKHGKDVFKMNKTFHSGFNSKGVGLFMIKNQIESVGGQIHVASKPGHGSTFTINFGLNK